MEMLALSVPAVVAWAAAAYKAPALRRNPKDRTLRAYWLTLVFLALTFSVLLPPVYVWLGTTTHLPNFARWLGNSLGLGTAWSVQALLLRLNYPETMARRKVRVAAWAGLVTIGLMAVFLILARAPKDAIDFTHDYGGNPFIAGYRIAFLAYLAWALISMVMLSWRYAGLAGRPVLSLGLRLVSAGGVCGLAYAIHDLGRVASLSAGHGELLPHADVVQQVLITAAVGLTVAGSTMPAWGRRLGIAAACDWVVRYRTNRRLYPLWRALYQAVPDIALLPPVSPLRDALTVRDVGFRLYRRVVEIQDAYLELRPYADGAAVARADALSSAAGLARQDAEAVMQATWLASAVRRKSDGGAAPMAGQAPTTEAHVPESVDVLERVAHSYRCSAIARMALEQQPLSPVTGRTALARRSS